MELDNYIIDHEINKENFNRLIEQFDKKNFIPFIGAGPSVPTGEPNWDELFKRMKQSLKIRVNRSKYSDGSYNYPKSFSKLFKKMNDKSKFFEEVFRNIEPTETSYTAFYIHLVNTFDSYITTNYDTPIEQAYLNQKGQKIRRYFFTCYDLQNLSNSIVYLHGHKDINFAILKEEDYDYFYPTVSKKSGIPILEDFLEKVYTKNTMIFIGFSFTDRYTLKFFEYLATKHKSRNHFLLTWEMDRFYSAHQKRAEEYKKIGEKERAKEEEQKYYQDFIRLNIYPIVYKRNIFVERLLEKLERKAQIPEIESYPITGEVG